MRDGFRIRSCLLITFPAGFRIMVAPLKMVDRGSALLVPGGPPHRSAKPGFVECAAVIGVVAVTAISKAKKRNLDLRGIAWAKNALALANDPGVDCLSN